MFNHELDNLLFKLHHNRKIEIKNIDKEKICLHTINYNNIQLTIKYHYYDNYKFEGLCPFGYFPLSIDVMKYILNNLNKNSQLKAVYNLMFNKKEKNLLELLNKNLKEGE